MGSKIFKKRMGPIEKQGVVQAYTMLVPTVAIVMAIVLFPLIANFWISFKDVTVSDLRIAEIKGNEDLLTLAINLARSGSSKSEIKDKTGLNDEEINKIYSSLRNQNELDSSNYTSEVYIIDKQRNQRGRIDDRDNNQIENKIEPFGLYSYNSIIVSEIKKKMNDDIRILFTEYRQKRKGNFNSNIRRISNLDGNDK